MPRSSETVTALAPALAKAQAELVNPEKSLTATIRTGRDIVRKTLGQHEIADRRHSPYRRYGQSGHHAGARFWRVDRIGLAGLSDTTMGGPGCRPGYPIPFAS